MFLPFLLHSNVNEGQDISLSDKRTQYFKKAEELQKNGEFLEAVEIINKSLALIKTNPDKERECDHLIKLGLLYWNLGQMSTSTEKYQEALKLAKKYGLKKQELECQRTLEIYSHYVEAKKFRDKDQYHYGYPEIFHRKNTI